MFKMLYKSYSDHASRLHIPAVLGQGSLSELHYLNLGDSTNRTRDIVEIPKVPRPYFIFETLEPSIETLFKSNRTKQFPVHTSIFITIGCIKALRLLHMKGFAHRNVQPAYFSLRLPRRGLLVRRESELCDLVAITELWTCRKYRAHLGRTRTGLSYVGNWKYGSIETLTGKEPRAVDDLISCIYILTEFVLGQVPWHTQTEKQAIINSKKELETSERLEDAHNNVLLINYRKLYEWLRSQSPFRTINYEAFYEEILKLPDVVNTSGAPEPSLFGFSNPLNITYEHGFVEKKAHKAAQRNKNKCDASKSSERKRKEKNAEPLSRQKDKDKCTSKENAGIDKKAVECSAMKGCTTALEKKGMTYPINHNKSRFSKIK
ncbi:hypothetical protein DICVIV_04895 [Dictyocaulus viviparus]|uniref:Protein kinase domain-containing protein n=1 Tax=Dictyocaulus viviparus TaxID=29172 RepID=A0A0D8Y345_DICVI|nr:hypothetical protein DICVIV_04895 [Dictyocaulus viviparus]